MSTKPRAALVCRLPGALEYACLEYLSIGAVCALQCVSGAWRTRIGVAVRERFRWDIRYRDGVDAPVERWLPGVCEARVNVRALHLVSGGGVVMKILCYG